MTARSSCGRSRRLPPRVLLIGSRPAGRRRSTPSSASINGVIDHAPVLIVQHMPPTFTTILAEHLARASGRPAREAVDGEPVVAGRIYVAPGGRHMRVVRRDGTADDRARRRRRWSISASRRSIRCSPRPPRSGAASNLAVVLTGMGSDGARGAGRHRRGRRLRDRAGRSDQRGVGHAGRGRACRAVLGGAAARPDRAEDRSACFVGARP